MYTYNVCVYTYIYISNTYDICTYLYIYIYTYEYM